jgi:hypothetical protein
MKKIKNIVVALLLPILINPGDCFAEELVPHGLRVPRLTTAERDQIPIADPQSQGIIIFNTDINCQEFWNGTSWISLCGVANLEVEIPEDECVRIRVFGQYFVSAPLDFTHYITLPVKVTQIGAYTISARSGNGYFFHTSGVFEELGEYELTLVGMGTPREAGINDLVFTSNGVEIGALCNITIEVHQLEMAYIVDCRGIQVEGIYRANRPMEEENRVMVPVEVLAPGLATIRTDHQNGLRFVGSQMFTEVGQGWIILQAVGSPIQEGSFRFDFTTDGNIRMICSFIVECISTLGTYDDPACSCLAISKERPFAPNGEYWLQDCRGFVDGDIGDVVVNRVRTFCDIVGGGWTLVWSYSEYTARNLYVQNTGTGGTGNQGTMHVSPAYWHFTMNRPRPAGGASYDVSCDDPENFQIDYNDFRLPQQAWEYLSADLNNQRMKVRITENPTNMRDQWALNNFAILSSTNRLQNPFVTEPTNTWTNGFVPTVGRVFGKRWEVRPGGGWDEVSGLRQIRVQSNTSDGFVWEWGSRGSNTPFEVRPNLGGINNTMTMASFDLLFGNFNSMMPNHHFGKCNIGPGSDDDFCFSTRICSPVNLVPHSFNDGQGRILQWFVR